MDIDAVLTSASKDAPSNLFGKLILMELKLMRKDVNRGFDRLEQNFQHLTELVETLHSNNLGNQDNHMLNNEDEMESNFPLNVEFDQSSYDHAGQLELRTHRSNIDNICNKIRLKQEANEDACGGFPALDSETTEVSPLNNCQPPHHREELKFTEELLEDSLLSEDDASSTPERKLVLISKHFKTSSESAVFSSHNSNVDRQNLAIQKRASPNPKEQFSKYTSIYNTNKNSTGRQHNHVCKICLKVHTSSHKLKRHYIEIHNQVNKNVCPFCHRSCYNKTDLKVHIRTHTGEKPFKCKICDKAFADKSNYTRHCRMRRDLKCPVCDKIVCTKFQFNRHGLSHKIH